jgi:fatty acid desaturase
MTAESSFEERLRALRLDRRNVALPGLFATWIGLFALLALPAVLGAPLWLSAALVVPIGLLQYRLVISGHEAVHRTSCTPPWLNEVLGIAGQALVGVNFTSYRAQHLDHHRAQTVADDPDGHIYGPIVGARPGLRRWTVDLFGTFVEIAVKIVQKSVGSIGSKLRASDASRAGSRRDSALVVVAQLAMLVLGFLLTGRPTGYVELWLAPLFGVAVLVNRSRILVEHGLPLLEAAPSEGRIPTVDIVVSRWERWVFAPYLFNYHCSHHLHLTVPHYNLPALHALLVEHRAPGHHHIQGSYLAAIGRAMRAPPVPVHPGRRGVSS